MVQLISQRLKGCRNISEVHHPSRRRSNLTANMDLDSKRMPVQPGTLMSSGHIRKAMSRLEREFLENVQFRPNFLATNATMMSHRITIAVAL
jgi:hypothetical protein